MKFTLEILEIVIEVLKVAVKHICNNVGKNNLILSKIKRIIMKVKTRDMIIVATL